MNLRPIHIMQVFGVLALSLLTLTANAQTESEPAAGPDTEAIAAKLDQTRTEIFTLFNEEEFQEIADRYCHEQITCIWQDGTTSVGRKGVVDFFSKLKEFIDVMEVNPSTTDRALFDGGRYVVSLGDLGDTYQLASGKELDLKSKWMATLVYEDEQWQLISFASSTNAFENQVIDGLLLMRTLYAGGTGLVLGVVLMLVLRRKKKKA